MSVEIDLKLLSNKTLLYLARDADAAWQALDVEAPDPRLAPLAAILLQIQGELKNRAIVLARAGFVAPHLRPAKCNLKELILVAQKDM